MKVIAHASSPSSRRCSARKEAACCGCVATYGAATTRPNLHSIRILVGTNNCIDRIFRKAWSYFGRWCHNVRIVHFLPHLEETDSNRASVRAIVIATLFVRYSKRPGAEDVCLQ